MKQTKTFRRVSVLVVAMLLITASFLSLTLAKYQTNIEGTYTATVAKWVFTADNQTESFTLTPATDYEKLKPGDTGSFTIELENASDVEADYAVVLDETKTKIPKGMTVTFSDGGTGSLSATDTKSVTVTWTWDFEGGEDDNDWYNTTDYSKSVEIVVTVTGTQKSAQA